MESAVRELPLVGKIPASSLARLPVGEKPILLVVSDTEEEFDWSKPHDRNETAVTAMRSIDRAQRVFDEYSIRPCYVIDYPVASQPDGYEPLQAIHQDGRCTIGAHVHPWVNPPHDEEVCRRNSFVGNLPSELEEAKLRVLNEEIAERFGAPATVYKAGRYGVGPNTSRILEKLGFEVDLSVCPPFDYSAEAWPDFREYPTGPYWFGRNRRMLCAPSTGALVGCLGGLKRPVYELANWAPLLKLRAPGILLRLGAVERIHLSTEGTTVKENIRLTRWLHTRGERVFTMSFHSPSVVPGCTPYVGSEAELAGFLDSFRRYFDYFFGELGGVTMTPIELRDHLAKGTA